MARKKKTFGNVRSTRKIFKGHVFEVVSLRLRTTGKRIVQRDLVVHGGSCGIVPFIDANHVLLIRQFRFATGGHLWEIPAGTLEPGEPAAACARRELQEETGYAARTFRRVAKFYTCPGFCSEELVLFFAYGLGRCEVRAADDSDDISGARVFSVDEAIRMIHSGRIVDGKTIIGLLMAAGDRR
ncbi:MAG: NUDIX hydrolase [Planctomycetota bacterium]|nr:NUDIX hydrolase [Planctomycetota bacterium]